jgi:hypothetical protein
MSRGELQLLGVCKHPEIRDCAIVKVAHVSLLLISLPVCASSAELRPETVRAWDEYVQNIVLRMQERFQSGQPFLWTDELPERLEQVRNGNIVVSPRSPQVPIHVPAGLIHHWVGAAFLPETKLDEVLNTVRDYAKYKDFYHPYVIDATAIRQADREDHFSLLLMNRTLLTKTALETEWRSTYNQVDPKRYYSLSECLRIQEIDNYGQPSERKLPPDQGGGYIWRFYNISRFQERDGGVYVENEVLVLSRDIPMAFRWVVDPIVRRVSKSSLVTSLRQTQDAVGHSLSAGISDPHRTVSRADH